MSDVEIWKPVVGWEGYYAVSSHGRMRSDDRVIAKANGVHERRSGRILRPQVYNNGYLMAELWTGATRLRRTVHRLIAEAFIGPCPPGFAVHHRNGNRTDNRLSNLCYVDDREHGRLAIELGQARGGARGEANIHAKLTADDVRYVRNMRGQKTQRALAIELKCSVDAIAAAQRRETWKHLE